MSRKRYLMLVLLTVISGIVGGAISNCLLMARGAWGIRGREMSYGTVCHSSDTVQTEIEGKQIRRIGREWMLPETQMPLKNQ